MRAQGFRVRRRTDAFRQEGWRDGHFNSDEKISNVRKAIDRFVHVVEYSRLQIYVNHARATICRALMQS